MNFEALIAFLEQNLIEYKENAKTSSLVSIKIGGYAKIIIYPHTVEQLVGAVGKINALCIKYCVIGKGTNCYFCDGEYDGAVVVTSYINKIRTYGNFIEAQCGAPMAKCSEACIENGLSGMEFARGIPGSVAGGVYMNASAFGSCIADIVRYSAVYDVKGDKIIKMPREDHCFSDKHSVFSENCNFIILETVFELSKGTKENIRRLMSEFSEKRRKTQPLEYPSAGSVFKRPVGAYASKLIDDLGLKGLSVGGVSVSKKHAGFIVNVNGGTAGELLRLIDLIKVYVKAKSGFDLCEEIIYME